MDSGSGYVFRLSTISGSFSFLHLWFYNTKIILNLILNFKLSFSFFLLRSYGLKSGPLLSLIALLAL